MGVKIPVPEREVLVDLYYNQGLRYNKIAEYLGVSQTVIFNWMKLHDIPPRPNPQFESRVTVKNGKTYKTCYGPLHNEDERDIPIESFHRRGAGENVRWRCKACESFRKGIDGYVPVDKFAPWLESIVRRIGAYEASRRLNINPTTIIEIRSGKAKTGKPKRFIEKRTARSIVRLLAELRETGEVRHRDSIRHGSSARGRTERKVTARSDLYVPGGDVDTERRRNNRHENMEREREYTRNRNRRRKKNEQVI
jgi:hypothetical protein